MVNETVNMADYGAKLEKEATETKECLKEQDKNGCRPEVKDYDSIWKDGTVICQKCGKFVRYFDAG